MDSETTDTIDTTGQPTAAPSGTERVVARAMSVVLIGVVGLGAMSAITFAWGVAKTYDLARTLLDDGADSDVALVVVLEGIDLFLLATVLLILAIGLYELFVAPLPMPGWLVINSLTDLKAKVSDVVVLLLAIKFLEKFVRSDDPLDLVWYGISIALVGGLLIAFKAVRAAK